MNRVFSHFARSLCIALSVLPSLANAESPKARIRIRIEPRCEFFWRPMMIDSHGRAFEPHDKRPIYISWDPSRANALAYKDSRTSITFYVQSDGRHLSAIDKNGKLLWVKNPFEDSALCQYRTPRPVIRDLRIIEMNAARLSEAAHLPQLHIDPHDKYLWLRFDSSQAGYLNERTGYFSFMQQN